MARVAAWTSSALVAVIACSSPYSGSEPTTGADGGTSSGIDGGPGDAGPPPTDGPCSVTPAGATVFTDDFEGASIDPAWAPTGAVALAPSGKPGGALRVAVSAAARADAYLEYDLAPAPKKLAFEVDFRVAKTGIDYAALARIQFRGASSAAVFGLGMFTDSSFSQINIASSASVPVDTAWHHLAVCSDMATPGGAVWIDGTKVSDQRDSVELPMTDNAYVRIGLTNLSASGNVSDVEVFFDNAVLRTAP